MTFVEIKRRFDAYQAGSTPLVCPYHGGDTVLEHWFGDGNFAQCPVCHTRYVIPEPIIEVDGYTGRIDKGLSLAKNPE